MEVMTRSPINLFFKTDNSYFRVHIAENQEDFESAISFKHKHFRSINYAGSMPFTAERTDKFDDYYSHLLVTDMYANNIAGYCRILRYNAFPNNHEFYTETIFDIENVKSNNLKFFEIGKLCIDENYRKQNIIGKIWNGFYAYADYYKLDYLSGAITVDYTNDISSKIYAYAKNKNKITDESYFATPLSSCLDTSFNNSFTTDNIRELRLELPSLFLTYLTFGAKIASMSAYAKPINSICFYILCDITSRGINKKFSKYKPKDNS